MFDLSEEFGSNEAAEVEGVWAALGEGAGVKIARLGNTQAQKAYRKLPPEIQRQLDEGVVLGKQSEAFMADFMATHILKDWKGLADKGKALPAYTPAEGKKFMLKHRRFRERVLELSQKDGLFNVEGTKADIKNS